MLKCLLAVCFFPFPLKREQAVVSVLNLFLCSDTLFLVVATAPPSVTAGVEHRSFGGFLISSFVLCTELHRSATIETKYKINHECMLCVCVPKQREIYNK